jgi:predicted acetyltransferase
MPVSGLWASEAGIYGRFGYGLATEGDIVTIERANTVELPVPVVDAVEPIDEATARELLPGIYARAIAKVPGALVRSEAWWRERRFLEIPFVRGGASRRRHVIVRRAGNPTGYLQYRQRPGFTDGVASGKTEIVELIGLDAQAEASLWKFALRIDLFPTVTWWNAPVDDSLAWRVADARRVIRRRSDGMWLRIGDVPRTLAARSYEVPGTLRIRVDGQPLELVVGADGAAECSPTDGADLELSRSTLGTLFLGCASATRLARAGLVAGDPRAIARADRMFATPIAPWCPEIF